MRLWGFWVGDGGRLATTGVTGKTGGLFALEKKIARHPLKLALPKGFTGQFRTKPFWMTGQVVLSRLDCAEGTILENNGVVWSQDQFLFRSHLLSPDSNPSKLFFLLSRERLFPTTQPERMQESIVLLSMTNTAVVDL